MSEVLTLYSRKINDFSLFIQVLDDNLLNLFGRTKVRD